MPDPHYSLLAELEKVKDLERPPIHLWNPDNVKDIDIRIARDGTWYHEGTPIERHRLVRLFATVMRLEDDGEYYLVTPVEKCRILVEDAPFLAVVMDVSGDGASQRLTFTTNVAETVVAGHEHPIRVEFDSVDDEPAPYVMVRDGLEALISRNVFYEMVDLMVPREIDGVLYQGVWSDGEFFPFARSDDLPKAE
ncbi:MAG: DUF1285 domain-containing protein [Pseudomonadales bacterium]|nr:DUF1285 domain-containing protein [Pseudomonadales bacterium]